MTAVTLTDLLARGQANADAGSLVDALLYFRQAMRVAPAASEPRLRFGEVLWRLDRKRDALQVWREAAVIAPQATGIQEALAEGLLAIGDYVGARTAADAVLSARSHEPKASLAAAIADFGRSAKSANAMEPGQPGATVVDLLQREPTLWRESSLMTSLASALDSAADPATDPGIRFTLARLAGAQDVAADLPSPLLATLIEAVQDAPAMVATLAPAVMSRTFEYPELETLRRLARAVCGSAPELGAVLLRNYANLCARLPRSVPLQWPLRSAGSRLRVLALLPAHVDSVVASIATELGGLSGDAVELALMIAGGTPSLPPGFALPAAVPILALPARPEEGAARAMAAFDPDVVVDLCGVAEPVGPVLALRPGRVIVTVASLGAPTVPPLVDRVLADQAALIEFIEATRRSLPEQPECAADRVELLRVWQEGVRAHSNKDTTRALTAYARMLELQQGHPEAAYLLGVCRRDEGDLEAAAAAFAIALEGAPGYADARIAAARNAIALGRVDRALTLCEEGVAIAGSQPALWRELGAVHLARRDGTAAARAFERALEIVPTDAETNFNLGVARQFERSFQDAGRAYQRALLFAPDMLSAQFNLGVLFQEQGIVEHAIAAYRQVLAAEPHHLGANRSLGEALLFANRIDEFCAHFLAFEAHWPDSLSVATQALAACQLRPDFGRLQYYLDGLRDGRFRPIDERELLDSLEELLYQLLFFDVDPETMLTQYRAYDVVARKAYGPPLQLPATRTPGRLRLGYLSADMRDHVMGKMMLAAIEKHDRSRFEVHLYSLSESEDEWTARFRAVADRFDRIGHLSERDAARHIARDELDILVDLGAHTRGAKPGIMVCKPARVQITHVASAGAVGCSTIDFKLTDRFADLPESGAFLVERLLPMQGCVYPFRALPVPAGKPNARQAVGLRADAIVIGVFVAPMKLSRRCLALWREVLARLPRAQLLFSPLSPSLKPTYRRIMAAAGIAADRVLFLPPGRSEVENLARYAVVDFVLDPMPFGGVNGVLEPLSAGVPVVTLVGKRHGERSAYSILSNLGVAQTIAHGGREYVDIAVRLAEDANFAASVREAIRFGLAKSPLVDMVAHTQALEDAYLSALAQCYPSALEGHADG